MPQLCLLSTPKVPQGDVGYPALAIDIVQVG